MAEENTKDEAVEAEDVVATDEEGNPLRNKKVKANPVQEDDVVTEENGEESIQKLRERLKACVQEKQQYLDSWQRDKADFLNARKRSEEEKKDFLKFSNENLISELLPVLDSFNMAMGNKEAWEKIDKNWRMGVEYIASQFKKVLEENGLAEIDPLNQKFDPMRDEAIEYVKVEDEAKDNIVTSVIQKGYSLNGRMVKAPKVIVGEHASKPEAK